MTSTAELLKPSEAAVVSGVDLRFVNHAIDRKWLPERVVRRGRSRRVSAEACIYIAFYHASADRLAPSERRFAINEVSRRAAETYDARSWRVFRTVCTVDRDFIAIDLKPFVAETHERLDRYIAARDMVTSSSEVLGGTPVIKGTRIPIHDVAASVSAGLSTSRVQEAYPSLTEEQVKLASLYAKANPLQGRPPERPIFDQGELVSTRVVARRRARG